MGVTLKIFSPDKLNKPCINCGIELKNIVIVYLDTSVTRSLCRSCFSLALSISEFVKLTNHSEAQKF